MLILLSFLFSFSNAYLPNAGPISLSMGGGGRAAFNVAEGLYLNPAAVAINGGYYLAGTYLHGDIFSGVGGDEYGAVVADGNEENIIPAALGFRSSKYSLNSQEVKSQSFRLGTAYSFRNFSVGVAAQRTALNSTGLSLDEVQYQADIGALWSVNDKIVLGLVGQNILSPNQNIPIEIQSKKLIALGAQYVGATHFSLRWDILYPLQDNDLHRIVHQMGMDSKFYDEFHFRFGYELDDYIGQSRYALGLGWEGPRLKFAYAFQQTLRNSTNDRHMIDLWLNF